MGKLTFASFKEVGLTGAGATTVMHVHLQYSAQVRHTQEYLQYSLVLKKENRNS